MDIYKIKYWFKTIFHTHFTYNNFKSSYTTKELFENPYLNPSWLSFNVTFYLFPTITWESEKDAVDKWSIHILRVCWLFWTFTPICKIINHKY